MRMPGWRARLNATIESFRRAPYRFGAADCAVLAASAVEAVTGSKPGPAPWYRYKSEKGALGIMKRAGFDNLADLVASVLPEIRPSQANVGDIAAIPVDGPFGFALGVVTGDRIFVFGSQYDGLGTVDLLTATRTFRVD